MRFKYRLVITKKFNYYKKLFALIIKKYLFQDHTSVQLREEIFEISASIETTGIAKVAIMKRTRTIGLPTTWNQYMVSAYHVISVF